MGATRVTTLQLGPIILEAGVLSAVTDEGTTGLSSICQHTGTKHGSKPAAKIRRRDFCPTCDNDDKEKFGKGRVAGTSVTVVESAELEAIKQLDQEAVKKIVINVHPAAELAVAIPSGKTYYLAPRGPAAASNYLLLGQVLANRPNLAFVGEFSFGSAASLYQILVDGDVLILRQLARPELIKDRPVIEGTPDERYLDMLTQLAELTCTPFDPAAYRSKRLDAIGELLAKATTVALGGGEKGEPAAPPVDLATALQAALDKAGASAAPAKKPARRRTTKKTEAA